MLAKPPSPCVGHATPMQSQKPSTRTVAQRKVYGKRRNNAAKAVFDQKSPTREASSSVDAAVEAIQSKLADVTINEEPTPTPEAEPEQTEAVEEPESEPEASTPEPESLDESPAPTAETQPTDLPDEEPSQEEPAKPKYYEQMVEVRVPVMAPRKVHMKKQTRSETSSREGRHAQKKIPTGRRSSGFVHDAKANNYVRPILDEALSPIASQSIQRFETWASRSANMFHVVKLAEGSYGEVYKLHLHEEGARPMVSKSKLAKLKAYGDGVFKVVPLRAQSGPGSKKFTSIEEIVSEAKMLKYLDPIPGFARFREIHVVQGRFPESFQKAWDYYKKTKDDCLNPNPASKKAYPDSQLWAIVEMDDAGRELEKFTWSSIFQIYDIFWGVAMALTRAEEYAMFEHRDLHLGNVCIRSTRPDGSMEPPSELVIARQASASGFGISSIETTIIDYSLSRADLYLPGDPEGWSEVASSDLDKKKIFDAIGQDEDDALLRDTYRYMRATLYTGEPSQTQKTPDIPGIWAEYAPRTNLVWLLFLLKNLLKNRKPEPTKQPAQPQRQALAPCSPNRKTTNQFGSAKTKASGDADVVMKERQNKGLSSKIAQLKQTLEDRLLNVLELLDMEHGDEDMCCAADLVAYAMHLQWLTVEDFEVVDEE
ncbi:hypothetical protein N7532_008896 [Penicillium argentinense]|uniref:non-specific serine/threonine protein kinase n=1 Tax=Penicillium argentinense TaxID=1131581 RepID=A0A9W9K2Y8_9EURO|nr:uncharacterized protein N7532_008896 [Penicillium argentinense]KAJ5090212.1 hypothetical protein N7532_008896 [Penicillium argentinense]